MQVFGVNYNKSFSPAANSTTTRILIIICLSNDRWECHIYDVEAAFLENYNKIPLFMEWPPRIVLFGVITEKFRKKMCIQNMRCIYGDINAARRFYETYSEYLMKKLGLF